MYCVVLFSCIALYKDAVLIYKIIESSLNIMQYTSGVSGFEFSVNTKQIHQSSLSSAERVPPRCQICLSPASLSLPVIVMSSINSPSCPPAPCNAPSPPQCREAPTPSHWSCLHCPLCSVWEVHHSPHTTWELPCLSFTLMPPLFPAYLKSTMCSSSATTSSKWLHDSWISLGPNPTPGAGHLSSSNLSNGMFQGPLRVVPLGFWGVGWGLGFGWWPLDIFRSAATEI